MNNLDAVIQDAVGTCLARLGDNKMSWREEGRDVFHTFTLRPSELEAARCSFPVFVVPS